MQTPVSSLETFTTWLVKHDWWEKEGTWCRFPSSWELADFIRMDLERRSPPGAGVGALRASTSRR